MIAYVDELKRVGTIEYAQYSAGELERISGLSTDMQRIWRRRGQLPSLDSGHARFSPKEVVETTVRYLVSKLGISPSETDLDLSGAFGGAMVQGLLNHHGACEVFGPADDVDRFLREFERDWDIALMLAGDPTSFNYLILDDEHRATVANDPSQMFDDLSEVSVVVRLADVGGRLAVRGRKPVVTFRFPERPGSKVVRRLTGVGTNDS